jgi:hypothetical protein
MQPKAQQLPATAAALLVDYLSLSAEDLSLAPPPFLSANHQARTILCISSHLASCVSLPSLCLGTCRRQLECPDQPACRLHTMPRTERTECATQSTTRAARYAPREPKATVTASLYTPIDSENGEIRLLELAPGKFEDDIGIFLIPANLNDDPSTQYEALSYVWGTSMAPQHALLDGVPIAITQNLDCALRHLREKNCVRRPPLWIDALSINQKDTQE